MKALLGLLFLIAIVYGCSSITGNDTRFPSVTVRNRSDADTIRIECEVDTVRILPGREWDFEFDVGGLHRIDIEAPSCTMSHYAHIESDEYHGFIDYDSR